MLVQRSMAPGWLSNAYVIAARQRSPAAFVDSGGEPGPLEEAVSEWQLQPVAVLRTHSHEDHVTHEKTLTKHYGIRVIAESGFWKWGDLTIRGIATPGHSNDMVAFLVNEEVLFSGDTLFRDAVGGGDLEAIRSAVMGTFMALPDDVRVLPGHTDETTIGRERTENPFIRVWSGDEPEGDEPVSVNGRRARLIVWSPDYDGTGKAWIRYDDDGTDAIVGGSKVERG